MIRINLLGQTRPRAQKQVVPLEATLQFLLLGAAVAVAAVILTIVYFSQKRQLDDTNKRIASLRAEEQSLQQVKQDVDRFESQKSVLQQRIDVIEALQRNRTGAQDLLQMVANTVVRVDALWLTSLDRKGNTIEIQGVAGSINAVANFITELKRTGYFDQVEIKTAKENDLLPSVETYGFTMSVNIASSPSSGDAAKTQPAAAPQPPQPAAKGRS
jgi:type IV pilus assembly protein PilN